MRIGLIAIIVALMGLLAGPGRSVEANPVSAADASADVNLEIEEFCDVQVGPDIYEWGQGHTPQGDPNYALNGAAANFVGGAVNDLWIGNGAFVRKFANGAVARTDLTVHCNTAAKVRVIADDGDLIYLYAGEQYEIPATGWIGWEHGDGKIWIYDEREDIQPTPGGGLALWLYVCARRQGLQDLPGTYTGTVHVEIMPMSP
ncbi:MAG: hypothetical protein KAW89_01640 [Armatimonadetes bacterium]|nr:hypothetical protein [Armatimonadota bacterium]